MSCIIATGAFSYLYVGLARMHYQVLSMAKYSEAGCRLAMHIQIQSLQLHKSNIG